MVKQNWSQTVAQLTAQYNAGPSRTVSEHTVHRTLLDMGLRSKLPTRVPLMTKCHRQLRLRWPGNITTGPWISGRELPGQMNHGYLNIIADQLHPYMASVFPAGNEIFQQDNTPCHKAKIVLERFQEHGAEFQLTSWLPNLPDLN
ncbi:transposable element Tc1 transposase [Trichonephila clavipes]|nr:transposable element Tc1 transposase [Trichonephila clavipes]